MLKSFILIGLGAAIAFAPLAALAQNAPPAAPATHHHRAAHKPTGSHRSEMRKRHNTSKERARASAEHMRTMRSQ